jgi:hypothetical protein
MIRLFLENRVGVVLTLPFFIGLYIFLNSQFPYYQIVEETNLGFWSSAFAEPAWLSMFLGGFFVLINAIGLNWIFNSHEFLDRNSYIVSLLYVVTMSFYHSFYSVDGLLIAQTFIICMLSQFFQLKQNTDGRRNVFNGFLFAGLAATFHPFMIFTLPILLGMILIIRPFVFREFFLALGGFLIPLTYALVYQWYFDHDLNFQILKNSSNFQLQTDFLITLIFFGILLALGTFSLRTRMLKSSIRLKKQIQIIWLLVFVSLSFGIIDFLFFRQIERFSLLLIPLSILLTYSFLHKSYGIISSIVFYLTIIYSVVKFFVFIPGAQS